MTLHRRAPRSLSGALAKLETSWSPNTVIAEVQGVWGKVVGEAIAAEATPARERAGVLTVNCSAAVWAQELELMSEAILEGLNPLLTRGRVTRLRCVVGT